MIAQNEVDVQAELVNKTDNHTVSYKRGTGRVLVQIMVLLQLFHTRQ